MPGAPQVYTGVAVDLTKCCGVVSQSKRSSTASVQPA
eukprot:CAMPEP_0204151132 /NCGR_PEP_ID=MMETSP0361-20130328/25891_1 /ASSEMBLY_ACC=CAM_ASM_000343 /TAXON_ID=268821 /ORGANISM="Scrippsiella Hangoei, Strain SHTV-5" /LENGTH=36 /DNA_ID= /DNA_START= /DNA_END= /DNA_ORIENTATION=